MQHIRVKKDDLIAAVQAARAEHEVELAEARQGFLKDLIEKAGQTNAAAERRLKDGATDTKGLLGPIQDLEEPVSCLDSFDQALSMLAMSADDIIELSKNDYEWYVLGKFPWAQEALRVNSTYSMTARAKFRKG